MKQLFRLLIPVALLIMAICRPVAAQSSGKYPNFELLSEAEQAVYDRIPTRILPDARAAFSAAKYDRAIALCNYHYIYYGDKVSEIPGGANELKDKNELDAAAKRCYDLTQEMNALLKKGDVSAAKDKAGALFKLNNQDERALQVLMQKETHKPDTVVVPVQPAKKPVAGISLKSKNLNMEAGRMNALVATISPSDATDQSVRWKSSDDLVAKVDENGVVTAVGPGTVTITVTTNDGGKVDVCVITVVVAEVPQTPQVPPTPPTPSEPAPQPQELEPQTFEQQPAEPSVPEIEPVAPEKPAKVEYKPRTTFVVKAGAGLLNTKIIAPQVSLGLYDLGGSIFGLEADGYKCIGENMLGFDAGLVLRLAKVMYIKAGAGYFKYTDADTSDSTQGMCGMAGLNFRLGRHFCIEAGVRYYPEVKVVGIETVRTAGSSYTFYTTRTALPASAAPFVGIGLAF